MKAINRMLLEIDKINKYKKYLHNELFPLLEEWGMEILENPLKEDKTHLVYTSWLGKHDRCVMEFSTSSLLMDDTMDKMFCTINLNMRRVKAGGLSGDDAELDFEIITRAIEEAGFDIEKYN